MLAAVGGRAGAGGPAGRRRRRRLGRRRRDRRARGRQAPRRQPGPRRGHQSHARREQVLAAYQAAVAREQAGDRREVSRRATITGCWSWAGRSSPPPAASRPRSPATACTPSPELVDLANLDPRRGEHHATVLSKIKLDAVALGVLADQGLTPDSVPAAGHRRAHPPQRQPEHRRHGHRRDRAGPSAGGRPGRRGGPGRRPGRRRRGRGGRRHQRARWKSRAA